MLQSVPVCCDVRCRMLDEWLFACFRLGLNGGTFAVEWMWVLEWPPHFWSLNTMGVSAESRRCVTG